MGRTKRRRRQRKFSRAHEGDTDLDKDENLINLQKWLKLNCWINGTKLTIRHFRETGRGITSTKSMHKNNTLIRVPYDLMITFTTIQTHLAESKITLDEKLTMQDFLALYLLLELNNESSSWKAYINSLPSKLPDLPWLRTIKEINSYPQDLQIASRKNLETFESSLERVRKSIGKYLHCVSLELLFKWSYVLVNTRAVYVDPNLVWAINNSLRGLLLDEPSQALCPFLDMFNHHFHANTEAQLIQQDGVFTYELKTLTSYKAFEQIMISYGPHDNDSLLMQYGFFIPGNIFDSVRYEFQEVKDLIQCNFDSKKYRFIKDHKFDSELYIGNNDISFNLKALYYLLHSVDGGNWSAVIFSNSYTDNFYEAVGEYSLILLNYKLNCFEGDLRRFEGTTMNKANNNLMDTYLRYKISFVSELISEYS